MVKASDFWKDDHLTAIRPLNRPRFGTIHVQGPMRPETMIIVEVLLKKPLQVLLVEHNNVAKTLPADTPDQTRSRFPASSAMS